MTLSGWSPRLSPPCKRHMTAWRRADMKAVDLGVDVGGGAMEPPSATIAVVSALPEASETLQPGRAPKDDGVRLRREDEELS